MRFLARLKKLSRFKLKVFSCLSMKHYILTIFIFISIKSSAQKITMGSQLQLNGLSFETLNNRNNLESSFSTMMTFGVEFSFTNKIISHHYLGIQNISHSYNPVDFIYDYRFIMTHSDVCFNLYKGVYGGIGLPLGVVQSAFQSNNLGMLDLVDEENVPPLIYGYTALVGYQIQLNKRLILQIQGSLDHFLNSLDVNVEQNLILTTYALSTALSIDI